MINRVERRILIFLGHIISIIRGEEERGGEDKRRLGVL